MRKYVRLARHSSLMRIYENVPIIWVHSHPMRISPSVVWHTNVMFVASTRSETIAVAFAGHSTAATSIFTLVFVMLNSFMLVGGNVTRVPA